ncbi:MAG: amino acid ABC transporter permease [Clostridium sp.]|jgi:putative lysine transport system permease protein|nr:amino acid ABC transporter permease [Clostridium sp.]
MEKNLFEWIFFLLQKYGVYFWKGTLITLETSVLGTLAGFLLGFLLGIIQSTPIHPEDSLWKKAYGNVLKGAGNLFMYVFRGTPMMVQAMAVYYGLKQNGIDISSFSAAVLVILLNTGAYMAETVRGGILSIDNGQFEGGKALGMSHFTIMLSIVLPQAFRNIVPEMGNLFLTNLKMTSVLNVIGIAELYFATKTAANTYYRYFEAFLITGTIYLVLCTIFTKLLSVLEKKLEDKKDYELATEYLTD